jgi:hypothetical protein
VPPSRNSACGPTDRIASDADAKVLNMAQA